MFKDMISFDYYSDRASKVEMKHEMRLNLFPDEERQEPKKTWHADGTDWIVSHTATTRKRKTSPTPRCANESASRSVSDHVSCFADDDAFPLGCAPGVSCDCLRPFTTIDSNDAAVSLLVVRLSGSINSRLPHSSGQAAHPSFLHQHAKRNPKTLRLIRQTKPSETYLESCPTLPNTY